MNLKKILSVALIGAFIFGVSVSGFNVTSAASHNEIQSAQDKSDDWKNGKHIRDNSEHREPPKDENGNIIPPPHHRRDTSDSDSDNFEHREPPKDENGNIIPPPHRRGNDSDNDKDNFENHKTFNHDKNKSSDLI